MGTCVTITNENFEDEVLKSPAPVLLDFWASWCGPCRMLAPVVEALAADYAGRVKVGKVNVDEEGALAERHGVASIPTLVLYRGGQIADRRVGALPRAEIERLISG